jgi:hypothetical protein
VELPYADAEPEQAGFVLTCENLPQSLQDILDESAIPQGIRDLLMNDAAVSVELSSDALAAYLRGIERLADAAAELDLSTVFYDSGYAESDEWRVELPPNLSGDQLDLFLLSVQAVWAIKRVTCTFAQTDNSIRVCICGSTTCEIGNFRWFTTPGTKFRICAT